MSEQVEYFRDMKEFQRNKREIRYAVNRIRLKNACIQFQTFDNGKMLRVGDYDFWPSTGLYMNRKTKVKRWGIEGFIKTVKGE